MDCYIKIRLKLVFNIVPCYIDTHLPTMYEILYAISKQFFTLASKRELHCSFNIFVAFKSLSSHSFQPNKRKSDMARLDYMERGVRFLVQTFDGFE